MKYYIASVAPEPQENAHRHSFYVVFFSQNGWQDELRRGQYFHSRKDAEKELHLVGQTEPNRTRHRRVVDEEEAQLLEVLGSLVDGV